MLLKEEFESAYCERSDITRDLYRRNFVSLPCACGDELCEGWAKISLAGSSIIDYLILYVPDRETLEKMGLAEMGIADTSTEGQK